jgi:hypothetical protein
MGDKYQALDRDVEDSYRVLRAKNPRQHIVVMSAKEIIDGFYSQGQEPSKKEEIAESETERTSR